MKLTLKKLIIYAVVFFIMLVVWQVLSWNNNIDNSIYIPGRKFYFKVEYRNRNAELIKSERLDLTVNNGFYPERKQTQIIWELYSLNGNDTVLIEDKTGVVDSKQRFFIHQPRVGDMKILSFADFPQFSTFVFKDTVGVSKNAGEVSMAKTFDGLFITKVKTQSQSEGKTTITVGELGQRRVFAFSSKAQSELGIITCKYFFDAEYGFVKMEYQLPDSNLIDIQLQSVDFN